MKAFLEIELRGDNIRQSAKIAQYIGNEIMPGLGSSIFGIPPSGWVAEITGFDDKYKYNRQFLRFKKDYSRTNSKGSRGVYAEYILDSGKIYDVKEHKDRYFCTVDDGGNIIKLTEEEVIECLKVRSE